VKILVLGGTGLIGLPIVFALSKLDVKVHCVYRDDRQLTFLKLRNVYADKISHDLIRSLEKLLHDGDFDYVVNCLGVTKHNPISSDIKELAKWNIEFPRFLDENAEKYNYRFIHISTDCVFSGKQGFYGESDHTDAQDAYGITKALADATLENAMILRTSTIGDHPCDKSGLFNWFKVQSKCEGFANAIFSGMVNTYFAREIIGIDLIQNNYFQKGLFHVGATPIDKFSLLCAIKERLGLEVEISKNTKFVIDRSLDVRKYEELTGRPTVSWSTMLDEFELRGTYYEL
jgi:dTDP-4-dehydrorhamnose reductase